MAEQVISKLVATFSFKNDNKGFNDFNKSLENVNKSLLKLKVGLSVATTFLLKFTNDTLKGFVDFDNFIKRTGISETFATDMMNLAKVSNLSAETITSSLEKISRDKQDLLRGEGNISPYAFLGIDIQNKNTEQVFNDILEQINKIQDVAKRSKALRDLGLNENLANLNRNNLQGISTNLYLNDSDRKRLMDLNKQVSLFVLNMKLLRDKFIALSTPIKLFFELLNRLIKSFTNIIEKTIGLEKASKILSGAILGLIALFFPLTAKITAFLLILDDIITYFQGGESAIGNFIKKASTLQKIMLGLSVAIGGAFALTKINLWGKSLLDIIKIVNTGFIKTPIGKALMGGIIAYGVVKKGFDIIENKLEEKGNKNLEKLNIELQKSREDVFKNVDKDLLLKNKNYLSNNINIENNYNINGADNPQVVANNIVNKEKQTIDNFIRTN